jgi:hypothetical protein
VAATMPRKMIRQLGNKSCGLTPIAYANDSMPSDAFCGMVKRMLDTVGSMKRGEDGLASWSAKLEGGEYGSVASGSQ